MNYNHIGEEFIEKTKYPYLSKSDQQKGIEQPPLVKGYDDTKLIIDLPKPDQLDIDGLSSYSLKDAIEKRRSVRKYDTDAYLSLKELSWLLWSTQGIKEKMGTRATFRTVPSAGARHGLETYLLINRVESIQPGIYRFLPIEHKLIEVTTKEHIASVVAEAAYGQKMVENSAVTFIWTAMVYRMFWRYLERGYRFLFLDAGHVCQNLYLAAEPIDYGVCAIAAFHDNQMNELLEIDGKEEFTLYLASVGKKSND